MRRDNQDGAEAAGFGAGQTRRDFLHRVTRSLIGGGLIIGGVGIPTRALATWCTKCDSSLVNCGVSNDADCRRPNPDLCGTNVCDQDHCDSDICHVDYCGENVCNDKNSCTVSNVCSNNDDCNNAPGGNSCTAYNNCNPWDGCTALAWDSCGSNTCATDYCETGSDTCTTNTCTANDSCAKTNVCGWNYCGYPADSCGAVNTCTYHNENTT